MTVGMSFLVRVKVRIVLGVTADLQHALAQLAESHRKVGRCGALADAALAVDGKYLGGADLDARVQLHLHAAFAVAARFAPAGDLGQGYQGGFHHAATPV
jgi:hypothetical protein